MKPRFVLGMVRRELRAAARRFGFYGGCMAIGIAVVVTLHALREAVDESVDLQSREMLGADLRLASRDPFGPALRAALAPIEEAALQPPTRVTRLGSMALAVESGRSRLVDLLAIDGEYPIYGEVWTKPARQWGRFGERPGTVFVDSTLLLQLDVEPGERLRLGDREFVIEAAVVKAPGAVGMQTQMAPRVFMTAADLASTGLVVEGSLVNHLEYWAVRDDVVDPWLEEHELLLDESRVRSQSVKGYQEDMSEQFGTLTRYTGLVGLAALVLGSIGVAAGMRIFVREKLDGVALLRSIGASPADVVAIYAGLALCLGLGAGTLGILLCLPLVSVLPGLLGDLLPVEVSIRVGPAAIATGLALSVWATLLCALGPVSGLARVAPLSALRRDFGSTERARPGGAIAVGAAVVLSLVAASVWQAGNLRVGLGFAGGLMATVALLALAALALIRLLRRSPPRALAYWARQGIANLFRPRNHTLPTTIAIGFALFVVATVHAVQRNVLEQMAVDSRPDRPNFVLFDVQRDQVEGVEALFAEYGAAVTDRAPLVAARLSGVAGRPRSEYLAMGEDELSRELRWALQREYRLTYADALRDSEEIVAGEWWAPGSVSPDASVFPVSLERDLATSLGVGLGDAVTFRIQGVDVRTEVANIRQVDWGRMATNFFVVFPPAAIEHAPQSTVLLAHLGDEEARANMQRDLVGRFPNVSALDATLILRSLDTMLEQISIAVRLLSLFTLATGLAILVAASMAARHERAREALLLRILGAPRVVLRRIVATEAVVLAALAAFVGASLSGIAAWALVVLVFDLPFAPPWLDLVGLAGGTFVITALVGGLGSPVSTHASPQAALRQEAA